MGKINVDNLVDWDEMGDEAAGVMKPYHAQLMELAYGDASDLLGEGIAFDLSNPRIKETIGGLADRIKGIADTTKEEIRGLVDAATEAGWSSERLAQEIRDRSDGMSKSRAMTISRSESGTAYNQGALLSYEEAGVTEVEVLDGDEDEICAEANGQTWSLEEAAENPLGHPNCTRSFVPRVS